MKLNKMRFTLMLPQDTFTDQKWNSKATRVQYID